MVNKGLLLGPWNPLSLETSIPWSQGQVLKEEPLIYLPLAGPLTLPQESTPHLLMRSSCLATFPHCPNYPNLSHLSSSFKPMVLNLGYILEPSSSNLLIKQNKQIQSNIQASPLTKSKSLGSSTRSLIFLKASRVIPICSQEWEPLLLAFVIFFTSRLSTVLQYTRGLNFMLFCAVL